MIVKCKKIFSATTGEDLGNTSCSLTINKEYIVLTFKSHLKNGVLIGIIIDSGQFALYDLKGFEIISQKTPSSWKLISQNTWAEMMPEFWYSSGFFEKLYDGDKECLESFCNEAIKIYQEENRELSELSLGCGFEIDLSH